MAAKLILFYSENHGFGAIHYTLSQEKPPVTQEHALFQSKDVNLPLHYEFLCRELWNRGGNV